MNPHDEGGPAYTGPIELDHDGSTVMAEAHLSGFLQPIDGTFCWQGRLDPDDDLSALAAAAGRSEIAAHVPGGRSVPARLGEANPWGGYRISGRGAPPF